MGDIEKLIEARTTQESLTIACEECSELTKAITKIQRHLIHNAGRPKSEEITKFAPLRENLTEEIADVLICTDMLVKMFGISHEYLAHMHDVKMLRNIRRLDSRKE